MAARKYRINRMDIKKNFFPLLFFLLPPFLMKVEGGGEKVRVKGGGLNRFSHEVTKTRTQLTQ